MRNTLRPEIHEKEDPGKLTLKAKELLTAYYHQTAANEVTDAEVPFQVPPVNHATGDLLDLPLQGVIDLVEAEVELVEFKTPKATPPLDFLPDNIQLTAYSCQRDPLREAPEGDLARELGQDQPPEDRGAGDLAGEGDYKTLLNVANEVLRGISKTGGAGSAASASTSKTAGSGTRNDR